MISTLLNGLNAIYGPAMLIAVILVSIFMVRSGVGKSTSEAQASAITALKEEMEVMKGRIDNLKDENRKQGRMIRTVFDALKSKGIIITIDGDIISIEEIGHRKSTTVVRIQEKEEDS